MFIESPNNPKVKAWASLKDRKGRLSEDAFVAEGIRLVEEALHSTLTVQAVLRDAGASDRADALYDSALSLRIPVYDLSPKAFACVSDTVNPQGLAAIVSLPPNFNAAGAKFPKYVLVLDGVQDPGNVGTLLRTAEAFGWSEVFCSTGTADCYSPKVVRSSMGGVFRLSISQGDARNYTSMWRSNWPDGQVVVCDAAGSVTCDAHDFRVPTLIVIGSEASGPSSEMVSVADALIRIPMTESVESLNAAVAGSVVLYEAFRQRK